MVRPDDGTDLGTWTGLVEPSVLLVPVDTHIFKLGRNLGFTKRTDLSWKTAEEITAVLSRFDPADPPSTTSPLPPGNAPAMPIKEGCQALRGVRREDGLPPLALDESVSFVRP